MQGALPIVGLLSRLSAPSGGIGNDLQVAPNRGLMHCATLMHLPNCNSFCLELRPNSGQCRVCQQHQQHVAHAKHLSARNPLLECSPGGAWAPLEERVPCVTAEHAPDGGCLCLERRLKLG